MKSFVYLLLLCAAAHSHAAGETRGLLHGVSRFLYYHNYILVMIQLH